jgi:hypothetical protein
MIVLDYSRVPLRLYFEFFTSHKSIFSRLLSGKSNHAKFANEKKTDPMVIEIPKSGLLHLWGAYLAGPLMHDMQ